MSDTPATPAPAQDWRAEAAERNAAIDAGLKELGLSVTAEFIPFSKSRNAGNKNKSLNWRVTLRKNQPDARGDLPPYAILTTDYSAGIGHCPSYKQNIRMTYEAQAVLDYVVEHGKAARYIGSLGVMASKNAKPIMPDTRDVIHSLLLDASVLDARSFEEWARDFGYDIDSRKAETIYRECLGITLKLRNGIGEAGLSKLRALFQDY